MKRVLINISCSLLLVSCAGNNTEKKAATIPSLSLSDKVMKIAEALPLKRDSAAPFLSGLFAPADSLSIKTDGDFKQFKGGNIRLLISNVDSSVEAVEIWPDTSAFLTLNLKEFEPGLDSAWKDYNRFPEVKDPPPGVMGWYKDKQQKKKLVAVIGPSLSDLNRDSVIREIRISANEFH